MDFVKPQTFSVHKINNANRLWAKIVRILNFNIFWWEHAKRTTTTIFFKFHQKSYKIYKCYSFGPTCEVSPFWASNWHQKFYTRRKIKNQWYHCSEWQRKVYDWIKIIFLIYFQVLTFLSQSSQLNPVRKENCWGYSHQTIEKVAWLPFQKYMFE